MQSDSAVGPWPLGASRWLGLWGSRAYRGLCLERILTGELLLDMPAWASAGLAGAQHGYQPGLERSG